jgi:hypothetical protein
MSGQTSKHPPFQEEELIEHLVTWQKERQLEKVFPRATAIQAASAFVTNALITGANAFIVFRIIMIIATGSALVWLSPLRERQQNYVAFI